MKKFVLLLLALFVVSFVAADCSPYERMRLFGDEHNYTLEGVVYNVSIEETRQAMNSFNVTVNGVTYPPTRYNTSFSIDTGEIVYLGKPYAASPVMYTSIDFCMRIMGLDDLTAEDGEEAAALLEEIYGIMDEDTQDTNYLLWGTIVVLALIILYLLFRKKK